MTEEEVTVVHVAEEEVVASSSSKVEIVAEREKEKEDLSDGANERIVKEDTDVDGEGSYVFVNGNDAVNGDPVESDLEKNGNGIGGEDRGVEDSGTKGEVESESDLVKVLDGEDESCIGIVDQDKESTELCHAEGPGSEQKSGDLVESGLVSAINAEDSVSKTSKADQNGVSESPEDVSAINAEDSVSKTSKADQNGVSESPEDVSAINALPNGIAKHTVSEVPIVDSSVKQSDEVSSVSVSDSNGGNSVNDSVEENVADFRSKEKEDSGMVVANDGVEDNVVDSVSKEKENSEMPVADGGDCYVNISANDSAKEAVSEVAVEIRNEQNVDFEMPVSDNGVPSVSVSDSNGDGLPNVRAKDSVSEAVVDESRSEQNDGVPACVSDSNGNGLIVDTVDDTVSEVSKLEQNESSESVEADADSHGPVSNSNGDRSGQNGFSEIRDLSLEADTPLEKETGRGSISDECVESLQDVHTQDDISETVVINESVDSSQNSQQGQSSEVVERSPSHVTNEDENVTTDWVVCDTTIDSSMDTGASADVLESSSSTVTLENATVETGVSDATAETLQSSPVDDEKVETEVIKSDENNTGVFDSHHVENSEVDIKVEGGSIDDDSKSSCLDNGLKSETKISSDVSAEDEVSKGLAESDSVESVTVGDTDEKVAAADVEKDSRLAASPNNNEKEPSVVENLSAVSNRDISGVDGIVHESGASNCDANDNEQSCAHIKGGIQFGSVVSCQEPEGGVDEIERKTPFYYLIKVPRYDDENLKEKIRLAQIRVEEKTKSRDAIRIEIQSKRATCKEYGDNFDAAISQERAARDLHRSKRLEIESIQSVMNIEDIDAKIRNMEHMIQHETLPLKDEKQFIREIKQLKQSRDRLSSNMGRQDEVQQGLDQKDQIEERMKSLKREADQLKVNLLKAEAVTKAAKKKYHDENEKLNKLLSQFRAADDIRQEAYAQMQSLKKEAYEKNKYFWQYRDDAKTANDLASKRDKEALQNLCLNQVEKLMDLWNNNDEFRKDYLRCNVRSTLRRLRTLDGRALGPDEEPPVIPPAVNDRVAKDHTVSSSTLAEQAQEKVVHAKAEQANDKPVAKAVEQKNQTSKSEKPLKSVPLATVSTIASTRDKIEEAAEEKIKRTKEEEEAARKAEELRKEEEAAKLREHRRLEEITKAKEAQERKRRNAEKAQARAALRAQKEAEQKEKEREKRAKKKERRKVAAAGEESVTDENQSAPPSETPAEPPKESENKEKPVTVAKRPQKPPQFTKQSKTKSIPPPLRNRGKRRMQQWMWVVLTILVIFALFLIGNYNISLNLGLPWFNF
ncbi:hypothetical protein DITRI_Ditri01bG0180700 [Diplodiscus trichospermus]